MEKLPLDLLEYYEHQIRAAAQETASIALLLGLAYIETMAPNITDRAPLRSSQRVKSCCC